MEINKENTFDINDLIFKDTIGKGSYGKVKLVKHKLSESFYALKILEKFRLIEEQQVDHIYSELELMREINHPNIVKFYSMNQDSRHIYLLLEYIPGGELFNHLQNEGNFPTDIAKFYVAQITVIFDYLHSLKVVYRDLKPENILLDLNGYIKLTDFGLAKKIEGKTYTICGTPEYFAPEIVLNKGHSSPIDWWTLGVLTYEMLVGFGPFNDSNPMIVYQKILNGKVRFPKDMNKDAKSFIKQLLVADTTRRLGCLRKGAKDVYEHKWFKEFDWTSLISMTMNAVYKPKVKNLEDTSNFNEYPDSDRNIREISQDNDPFKNW